MKNLKHTILSLFFLVMLSWLNPSSCHAQDATFSEQSEYRGEKIYIESGLAIISDNMMFMQIDNEYFPITSIAVDANGVYVYSANLMEQSWRCGNEECRAWNFSSARECASCKLPKGQIKKKRR